MLKAREMLRLKHELGLSLREIGKSCNCGKMTVSEVLEQAEHSPLVGDLQQLQGLCESIDENAFIPFTPEDFGIDKARRIVSFYDIVDKVAAELINNMGATTKGLRATPQRAEYSRYLKLRDYGISVKFSSKHWINYEETPFWLTIRDDKWNFAKEAHEKLKVWENTFPKRLYEENKVLLIPLYAPALNVRAML